MAIRKKVCVFPYLVYAFISQSLKYCIEVFVLRYVVARNSDNFITWGEKTEINPSNINEELLGNLFRCLFVIGARGGAVG